MSDPPGTLGTQQREEVNGMECKECFADKRAHEKWCDKTR